MVRILDRKLTLKVKFWVIASTFVFITGAIRPDLFGYATSVYKSRNINTDVTEITGDYRPEFIENLDNTKSDFPKTDKLYDIELSSDTNKKVKDLEKENTDKFVKRNKTTHVAFLKVHKAGSTTIQNMFFRFGVKHDLNIILPKSDNWIKSISQVMPIGTEQHFDIFAIHTVYSNAHFDSLLPADYVSIAIVRSPVDRMVSAAYYHRDVHHVKYLRMIPRVDFVHNLVNYPEKYDRAMFSQTKNTMALDFGFSKKINPNDKGQIRKYLDELNEQFKLVMIMEKLDESLVLLRRMLDWSMADIIYLKTNSHNHNPVVLNNTEEAKFMKTSSFDFDIYDYFKAIFDEKLKRETAEFWEEVDHFKKLIGFVSEFCGARGDADFFVKATKWDASFKLTKSDCEWMNTKEQAFIRKLRERHLDRHTFIDT